MITLFVLRKFSNTPSWEEICLLGNVEGQQFNDVERAGAHHGHLEPSRHHHGVCRAWTNCSESCRNRKRASKGLLWLNGASVSVASSGMRHRYKLNSIVSTFATWWHWQHKTLNKCDVYLLIKHRRRIRQDW